MPPPPNATMSALDNDVPWGPSIPLFRPESPVIRTARELASLHSMDLHGVCPYCGQSNPCPVAVNAHAVCAAAGVQVYVEIATVAVFDPCDADSEEPPLDHGERHKDHEAIATNAPAAQAPAAQPPATTAPAAEATAADAPAAQPPAATVRATATVRAATTLQAVTVQAAEAAAADAPAVQAAAQVQTADARPEPGQVPTKGQAAGKPANAGAAAARSSVAAKKTTARKPTAKKAAAKAKNGTAKKATVADDAAKEPVPEKTTAKTPAEAGQPFVATLTDAARKAAAATRKPARE